METVANIAYKSNSKGIQRFFSLCFTFLHIAVNPAQIALKAVAGFCFFSIQRNLHKPLICSGLLNNSRQVIRELFLHALRHGNTGVSVQTIIFIFKITCHD